MMHALNIAMTPVLSLPYFTGNRNNIDIFIITDAPYSDIVVRTGGITNHHSIAYSFSNISAKNYQNRLIRVEVIVC